MAKDHQVRTCVVKLSMTFSKDGVLNSQPFDLDLPTYFILLYLQIIHTSL